MSLKERERPSPYIIRTQYGFLDEYGSVSSNSRSRNSSKNRDSSIGRERVLTLEVKKYDPNKPDRVISKNNSPTKQQSYVSRSTAIDDVKKFKSNVVERDVNGERILISSYRSKSNRDSDFHDYDSTKTMPKLVRPEYRTPTKGDILALKRELGISGGAYAYSGSSKHDDIFNSGELEEEDVEEEEGVMGNKESFLTTEDLERKNETSGSDTKPGILRKKRLSLGKKLSSSSKSKRSDFSTTVNTMALEEEDLRDVEEEEEEEAASLITGKLVIHPKYGSTLLKDEEDSVHLVKDTNNVNNNDNIISEQPPRKPKRKPSERPNFKHIPKPKPSKKPKMGKVLQFTDYNVGPSVQELLAEGKRIYEEKERDRKLKEIEDREREEALERRRQHEKRKRYIEYKNKMSTLKSQQQLSPTMFTLTPPQDKVAPKTTKSSSSGSRSYRISVESQIDLEPDKELIMIPKEEFKNSIIIRRNNSAKQMTIRSPNPDSRSSIPKKREHKRWRIRTKSAVIETPKSSKRSETVYGAESAGDFEAQDREAASSTKPGSYPIPTFNIDTENANDNVNNIPRNKNVNIYAGEFTPKKVRRNLSDKSSYSSFASVKRSKIPIHNDNAVVKQSFRKKETPTKNQTEVNSITQAQFSSIHNQTSGHPSPLNNITRDAVETHNSPDAQPIHRKVRKLVVQTPTPSNERSSSATIGSSNGNFESLVRKVSAKAPLVPRSDTMEKPRTTFTSMATSSTSRSGSVSRGSIEKRKFLFGDSQSSNFSAVNTTRDSLPTTTTAVQSTPPVKMKVTIQSPEQDNEDEEYMGISLRKSKNSKNGTTSLPKGFSSPQSPSQSSTAASDMSDTQDLSLTRRFQTGYLNNFADSDSNTESSKSFRNTRDSDMSEFIRIEELVKEGSPDEGKSNEAVTSTPQNKRGMNVTFETPNDAKALFVMDSNVGDREALNMTMKKIDVSDGEGMSLQDSSADNVSDNNNSEVGNAGDQNVFAKTLPVQSLRTQNTGNRIRLRGKEDEVTLDEFLELEAKLQSEKQVKSGLSFIAIDNGTPKEKKQRKRNVTCNFSRVISIIRSRVPGVAAFREISLSMSRHNHEHFVILAQPPCMSVDGVYLLDEEDQVLNCVWGTGPRTIKPDQVRGYYRYNTQLKEFDELNQVKFTQDTEIISI